MNIVVLDPLAYNPLKYYNPTSETSTYSWTDIGITSPVIQATKFESVRVVSACLIMYDLGALDSRAGRIISSGLPRSTILGNYEVSLDLIED
jgi:hypothetical protein